MDKPFKDAPNLTGPANPSNFTGPANPSNFTGPAIGANTRKMLKDFIMGLRQHAQGGTTAVPAAPGYEGNPAITPIPQQIPQQVTPPPVQQGGIPLSMQQAASESSKHLRQSGQSEQRMRELWESMKKQRDQQNANQKPGNPNT